MSGIFSLPFWSSVLSLIAGGRSLGQHEAAEIKAVALRRRCLKTHGQNNFYSDFLAELHKTLERLLAKLRSTNGKNKIKN